jgi:hypothetical protein
MDYPHPVEELRADGTIDVSHPYPQRIGDWDKVAINYGYREFPNRAEDQAALTKILDDAWTGDLRYFTNQDTDIHPRVEQWSNGDNQATELNRLMKVRRAALDRIGEKTIRSGAPMATIEEPLVPIFMYHRYAIEGTASMLGGQDFVYAMRGDGREPTKWETAANQRLALDALAGTLAPAQLVIPKRVLSLIPPRPPGFGLHRELFPRTTGEAFDPVAPGAIAADVTIGFALQLERASRLVAQHAVDPTLPGLEEVIDRFTRATFDAPTSNSYEAEVRRAEERVLVNRVAWLAAGSANSQVRAVATLRLQRIASRLRSGAGGTDADVAHRTLLASDIKRYLDNPDEIMKMVIVTAPAPPGAPIGDMPMDWLAPPAWLSVPDGPQ